jgi:hypothetical protein
MLGMLGQEKNFFFLKMCKSKGVYGFYCACSFVATFRNNIYRFYRVLEVLILRGICLYLKTILQYILSPIIGQEAPQNQSKLSYVHVDVPGWFFGI